MPQIADNCAYEDNDCCGYFGVDMPNFNEGGKQIVDERKAKLKNSKC